MATATPPAGRKWRWIITLVILAVVVVAGSVAVLVVKGHRRNYTKLGERYLRQANNATEALRCFRLAIKENPKDFNARAGMVEAHSARRNYQEALAELQRAQDLGMDATRAALLKVQVLSEWGGYRITVAGETATPKLCDDVLAENVDPAITLVQKALAAGNQPATTMVRLGDLRSQRSQVLQVKYNAVLRERNSLRGLQRNEEAAAREQELRLLLASLRSSDRAAIEAYTEAIEKDPGLVAPRVAIAGYEMTVYNPRVDRARQVLEPALRGGLSLRDQEKVRQALMAVETYANNFAKAIEHARALVELQKENLAYRVSLADVLIQAEQWDEAAALAAKLAESHPKDPGVAYAQGRVLMHQGRAAEAATFLQIIFSNEKARWPQARFELARALVAQKNHEQAVVALRRTLDDIASVAVLNARRQQELLNLKYQAHMALAAERDIIGTAEALDQVKRAFSIFPAKREALNAAKKLYRAAEQPSDQIEALSISHVIALAAQPNKLDEAIDACASEGEDYRDTPGKGARMQVLRARLLVRKGAYRDAIGIYEGLRRAFPDDAAYSHALAELHLTLKHDAEARRIYEAMLANKATDLRAVSQLLGILTRANESAAAQALLERADKDLGGEQVRAMLMAFYVSENRLADAVALARAQVKANPNSAPAHVLLAETLWKQGNLAEARTAYDTALRLAPNYAPAVRRALLDLHEGRAADAVTLLTAARERTPRNMVVLGELAVALQGADKHQEALAMLRDIVSAPASASLRGIDMPRWVLAVLYAGAGDARSADTLNQMVRSPEIGIDEDRQQLLDRLSKLPPDVRREAAFRLNLMILLDIGGCQPAAREQGNLLAKALPDEPLVETLRARILYAEGKKEEALRQYERIILEHPRFIQPRMLIADHLEREGKIPDAIQRLEDALDVATPERAAWVQFRLGKSYEDTNQWERAASSYQAAATHRLLAAMAYNNLAWMHAVKRNDPAAALPFAEQAGRLGGTDPAILDTVGWVRYLSGDATKALESLQPARQMAPNHPTIRYHLGMCLIKLGRVDEGRSELREALQIAPDFPEREDALRALGKS